jgi:hypothetical protein
VTNLDHERTESVVGYLEQSQNSNDLVPTNSFDVGLVIAKYRFNVPTAAISAAYPNYFRRKAQQYTEVTEVRVFGNDHETFASRVVAHFLVRRKIDAQLVNVI